jgi:hypothetical protein
VVIVGVGVVNNPDCAGVVAGVEMEGSGVTNAPGEVGVSTAPGVMLLDDNSGIV